MTFEVRKKKKLDVTAGLFQSDVIKNERWSASVTRHEINLSRVT